MKFVKSQFKEILKIAWPLIIANSFWNLQLTIDRIYIGHYSTEALGAAMSVMGVFWVPMALLQQTASYVTTFVAQYYGAKENHKIGSAVWQAIYVSLFGGLCFLLLNLVSDDFFSLTGHTLLVQELEIKYFNSVAYSALPTALIAVSSGFFTGLGNTKAIIKINLLGLVVNVFLDYIMIFGRFGFPALGIQGAGIATALSSVFAALYGLKLLFTVENQLKFKIKESYHFNLKLTTQFLKYGLPSGLQWALEGSAFTCFLILMGQFENGEAALAASSIAITVMMLSILPSMGVAQAVMTLVGQNLGNKNPDKAEVVTWHAIVLVSIYMIFLAFTFVTFPNFYISWFENRNNPFIWNQVLELAPAILVVIAIFTTFDSLYLNLSFALKGAGDTRFVSLLALILPWPLMVLPVYFVKEFNNPVIWAWGFVAVYSVINTTCLYLRFKQGKWRKMSVI